MFQIKILDYFESIAAVFEKMISYINNTYNPQPFHGTFSNKDRRTSFLLFFLRLITHDKHSKKLVAKLTHAEVEIYLKATSHIEYNKMIVEKVYEIENGMTMFMRNHEFY